MPEKVKLLVVEDEDSLRTLLTSELESRGFEVQEADGGNIALEALDKNQFDLVLLDIRLPDIDGMEVLKSIRKNGRAEKVIMLTGVDELKIAKESLSSGANDFMTKPYNFKNLLNCIERVLKE
jgi:DNA-binding response OmpR family regulator